MNRGRNSSRGHKNTMFTDPLTVVMATDRITPHPGTAIRDGTRMKKMSTWLNKKTSNELLQTLQINNG
jgi:hypothetical protein